MPASRSVGPLFQFKVKLNILAFVHLHVVGWYIYIYIYVAVFWVPPEHNPADDGSRGNSLRRCSSLSEVAQQEIVEKSMQYHLVCQTLAARRNRRRQRTSK